MHLPSEAISGPVCPVTAAVAACGISAAIYFACKSKTFPSAQKFALTTSAIFALQMLNVAIGDGISGHLIGGVLAAAVLGIPAGVLALGIVLVLQTLLFADGGLDMLGANILNMSIIGAGFGGFIRQYLISKKLPENASTFAAAFVSVMAAAAALCVELSAGAKAGLWAAMLSTHALVGLLEGAITCALVWVLSKADNKSGAKSQTIVLGLIILASVAVAPLACAYPDALEWTMQKFSILPNSPNFTGAIFSDYSVSAISNGTLSLWVAALSGIVLTGLFSYILCKAIRAKAA